MQFSPNTIIVSEEQEGKRLDQIHSDFELNSRSQMQGLIDAGLVLVNGQASARKIHLKSGDSVELKQEVIDNPEFDIEILHEDENVIVINKPEGLIVHGRSVHDQEVSVVSLLRDKIDDADDIRPGIVHRLDKATSGVLILAKNDKAKTLLQEQFANRTASKRYLAVVHGLTEDDDAKITLPIERNPSKPYMYRIGNKGKTAETRLKTLRRSAKYSLVELAPKTGRTHQLRVHMQNIGNPIVGDSLYSEDSDKRMRLVAKSLEIEVPELGVLKFEVDTPWDLEEFGLNKD